MGVCAGSSYSDYSKEQLENIIKSFLDGSQSINGKTCIPRDIINPVEDIRRPPSSLRHYS